MLAKNTRYLPILIGLLLSCCSTLLLSVSAGPIPILPTPALATRNAGKRYQCHSPTAFYADDAGTIQECGPETVCRAVVAGSPCAWPDAGIADGSMTTQQGGPSQTVSPTPEQSVAPPTEPSLNDPFPLQNEDGAASPPPSTPSETTQTETGDDTTPEEEEDDELCPADEDGEDDEEVPPVGETTPTPPPSDAQPEGEETPPTPPPIKPADEGEDDDDQLCEDEDEDGDAPADVPLGGETPQAPVPSGSTPPGEETTPSPAPNDPKPPGEEQNPTPEETPDAGGNDDAEECEEGHEEGEKPAPEQPAGTPPAGETPPTGEDHDCEEDENAPPPIVPPVTPAGTGDDTPIENKPSDNGAGVGTPPPPKDTPAPSPPPSDPPATPPSPSDPSVTPPPPSDAPVTPAGAHEHPEGEPCLDDEFPLPESNADESGKDAGETINDAQPAVR